MSSSVFFKFKSSREPQRITFDGTGITVFELKREIINVSGLGDGTDFDLSIYDESSNEEYDDDTTIIPRSSSVVARRLPAARPGHGKAARYVTGKAPVNAKSSYRTEFSKAAGSSNTTPALSSAADMSKAQTEEERLAAMFAAENSQWEQQQQQMANVKPVYHKGHNKRPANVPDHDPPPKYVCHRCGQPGHWIQLCPTNDDPNFESKPKIKRTTGIPRSFMKKVDKPIGPTDDGLMDDSHQGGTIMLDADGNHVIVNPDTASWEKAEAKLKASAARQEEAELSGSKELQELGLECPIDKRLFVEPMKTPCCGKTYCNDCIENALVDNDLTCPNCGTEGVLIDDLKPDDNMVARMRKYEDNKAAEKRVKEAEKSPKPSNPGTVDAAVSPSAIGTSTEQATTADPPPLENTPSETPEIKAPVPSSSVTVKKRPAEDELESKRSPPKAPAAMLRKQNQPQQPLPPGFDQKFLDEMNKFAPQMAGNQQFGPGPFFQQGVGPMGLPNANGMMGMPMSMPQMMGMQSGMVNQMMMPNQGNYPQMNTPMGSFPQQNAMYPNFGANMMPNGGYGGPGWQGGQNWGMPQQQMQNGKFGFVPNQQRQAVGPQGNEEENAYVRKPVNPHRAQNRQRRQARHNDYNTL